MFHAPFKREDLLTVSDALDIAEDRTGDYFKFSSGQWKRHRYDVKTLSQLASHEVVPDVFALLKKSDKIRKTVEPRSSNRDFYFICLQDHRILKAQKRQDLSFASAEARMACHIVRFATFPRGLKSQPKTGKKKSASCTARLLKF
jgi:hypothetical protein